jgi:hypothetical protein
VIRRVRNLTTRCSGPPKASHKLLLQIVRPFRRPLCSDVRRQSDVIARSRTGMNTRIATCACGQLVAKCRGAPASVSLCYCLQCQRRTGSSFGLAAFFDRAAVEIEGSAMTFLRSSEAGAEVRFHFCGTCGSTVYWEPRRKPEVFAVAVGCFADPGFPPPSKSVYGEHQHPWVSVAV